MAAAREEVLEQLADLLSGKSPGGKTLKFKDVNVVKEQEATRIVLPQGMSNREAILWLERKEAADIKEVQIIEELHGYPLDCAHALMLAIREIYGFSEKVPTYEWWGKIPPRSISIPKDHLGGIVEIYV